MQWGKSVINHDKIVKLFYIDNLTTCDLLPL